MASLQMYFIFIFHSVHNMGWRLIVLIKKWPVIIGIWCLMWGNVFFWKLTMCLMFWGVVKQNNWNNWIIPWITQSQSVTSARFLCHEEDWACPESMYKWRELSRQWEPCSADRLLVNSTQQRCDGRCNWRLSHATSQWNVSDSNSETFYSSNVFSFSFFSFFFFATTTY